MSGKKPGGVPAGLLAAGQRGKDQPTPSSDALAAQIQGFLAAESKAVMDSHESAVPVDPISTVEPREDAGTVSTDTVGSEPQEAVIPSAVSAARKPRTRPLRAVSEAPESVTPDDYRRAVTRRSRKVEGRLEGFQPNLPRSLAKRLEGYEDRLLSEYGVTLIRTAFSEEAVSGINAKTVGKWLYPPDAFDDAVPFVSRISADAHLRLKKIKRELKDTHPGITLKEIGAAAINCYLASIERSAGSPQML